MALRVFIFIISTEQLLVIAGNNTYVIARGHNIVDLGVPFHLSSVVNCTLVPSQFS
jgi:hypothetical protein